MRITLLIASLATLAVGTVMPVPQAEAAPAVCKQRSEIIKILDRKFSEKQAAYGLQSDRRVLEVYASANGSWTAILTLPSGRSCVVASGEAWTQLPPIPIGEPA